MKFTGEVLILLLLLITNGRIFFLHRVKQDRIVVLAPICFFLSILLFCAWGFDFFTIAIFILSLLVLLSNFHAMFRYSEKLYVDHYSPLMYVWSILTIILGIIILSVTVYFMPVEIQNQKLNIEETKYKFTGNFRSSFTESKFSFLPELTIYRYEAGTENKELFAEKSKLESIEETEQPVTKNIIIFFPDKTADTIHYKPYLQYLTKEGYTVYSGDFFSSDCRWMHSAADSRCLRRNIMTLEKLSSNEKFMQQREFYNYNISLECKEMFRIVKELESGADIQIYLSGDEMSTSALKDFYAANKDSNPNLKGYFLLSSLESYETPGFGCVKQTDPIVANLLGISRNYTFSDVQEMALETKTFLEQNSTGDK